MEKEEFKLRFIEQIRQENSPIWMLAVQNSAAYCHDGTQYYTNVTHFIDTFKVVVTMEKKLLGMGRKIHWDVRFDDYPEDTNQPVTYGPVMDFVKKPIHEYYFRECAEFENNKIIFSVRRYLFSVDTQTYTFTFEPINTLAKLTFDYNQRVFATSENIKSFLHVIERLRKTADYLDYVHTETADIETLSFLTSLPLLGMKSAEIYTAFNEAALGEETSTLTQIINVASLFKSV